MHTAPLAPRRGTVSCRRAGGGGLGDLLVPDGNDGPSPTLAAEERGNMTTVEAYMKICRLNNALPAYSFVLVGALNALRAAPGSGSGFAVLVEPQLHLVGLITVLITITSMITNDYFDFRLGTDVDDVENVLAQRLMPLRAAKVFVSRLYSVLLLTICLVDNTLTRVVLMGGAISTFLCKRSLS